MEEILERLKTSKFRSSFNLKKVDIDYIDKVGIDKISDHVLDFINTRLKPSIIKNDGKQTPYKGHPAFISMHACACCCRNCLNKWHNIKKNTELSSFEVNYIHDLLMLWIKKEYDKYKANHN